MSRSALAVAHSYYENLQEEDFKPVSIVDQFLESAYGSNWLHDQATDLVAGRDSDFVTQDQFRQHVSERLSDLEWNDDQDAAHVDLMIYAYTGQQGGHSLVKRLFGDDGLEGLAKDLLIIAGAVEQHLAA